MIAKHRHTQSRNETDGELLQRCRQGIQSAWDELVDRYGRLVYSIPRRLGLCESDWDDVFQGVFQTLFERLDTIGDPDCLPGWLVTTTRRRCWRLMRKAGRPLPGAALEQGASARDVIEAWESQDVLRRALEQLSDCDRDILTACFTNHGGDGYRDRATRLGMPTGSLGPKRARAFRRLTGILRDTGYAPAQGSGGLPHAPCA